MTVNTNAIVLSKLSVVANKIMKKKILCSHFGKSEQ